MTHNKKKGSRRRFRHNPFAARKAVANIGSTLRAGLFGAVAIGANKAISGQVSKMLGGLGGDSGVSAMRPYAALASALFLIPLIARATKIKGAENAAATAAAVEIFGLARGLMPASVQSALAGYEFPALPAYRPAANDTGVPGLTGGDDGALPIPSISF